MFVLLFTVLSFTVAMLINPSKASASPCYPATGTGGCWVGPGVGTAPDGTTCSDNHFTICPSGYWCSGPLNDLNNVYKCTNVGTTPPPNSCPSECRKGPACGIGYSSSTACGVCPIGAEGVPQVCCKPNSCANVPPPSTSTPSPCITTCTQVTECKQQGNCGGGNEGGFCGYTTTTPKVPKYYCTKNVCTTVCTTPSPPSTSTQPPSTSTNTPVPLIAQCVSTRIYSPNWTLITNDEYHNLSDRSQVYFCVSGSTTGGSFNKARFTINGTLYPETVMVRPGSADYCQLYEIPVGSYSTNVQGEVHHNALGWL